MDEQELGAVSALLSDFSTRMNDLEEQNRTIKERLVVISQTLLKQNDKLNKEISALKEGMRELRDEIDRLKEAMEHIVSESSEFARREEIKVLERYMKMFEPLKFATEDDVKRIVSKMIRDKDKGIIPVEEE
jgi:chromosome segregation ATPase